MDNTEQSNSSYESLDNLKQIYDSIQSSRNIDSIINVYPIFKRSALEYYEKNKDLNKLMQRKHFAFTSLISFCNKLNNSDYGLTEDFCLKYFGSLVSILKHSDSTAVNSRGYRILSGYIKISTSNLNYKIVLLQTLTSCLFYNKVNISIFEDDEIPSNKWCKHLLLNVLLDDYNLQNMEIIDEIDKLDDLYTNCNQNVTDVVLLALVNNRHKFKLDKHFVSDLIFAITLKQQLLDLLPNEIQHILDEITKMKIEMILQYCTRIEHDMLSLLLFQDSIEYYSKYPFEVIQFLTNSNKNVCFKKIVELQQLFEISKIDLERQIEIILQQNQDEPFNKLKNEISFELSKNIISVIFPRYKVYYSELNTLDNVLETIHLVSSSDIKCTCYNLNTSCPLHQTTECCDLLYVFNVSMAKAIAGSTDPSAQMIDLLSTLVSGINTSKRIIELINALETIHEYNIDLSDMQLNKFLLELTADNYEQAVHDYIVAHSFPGTYTKSVTQLIDELKANNVEITDSIVEILYKILDCYENKSTTLPMALEFGNIKSWDRAQISYWASKTRRNALIAVSDEEILAVIKRTIEVTVQLELRNVQLLSVLLMINSNVGIGRLAQINTGEGKTLIIAVLAAYSVFKGHKVDIYTSSRLLAIPQSKEYKDFFQVCGISVTHNINPNSNYKCDVIYGTNHSFQGDVLLDEYRKSGVRSGRKYDVAIVDEVDNMLIDGNNWILHISSEMPAMNYLEVLLAAIFIQVNATASALVERNGTTFYLNEESAINEQGNVNLENVVEEIPIEGSKRDFIMKCTEKHLRKLIRDTNGYDEIEEGYPEMKVLNHLREVICKVQLKRWINNAINAIFNYKKDENYILNDGKVTIVDADNTGVMKKNSHWCAGLHQFLQIKHGAKVQQENFTTNFISNVGLFTRYNSIYGLTGTLGSDDTRSFLHKTYNVDSIIIPPFKLKQHKSLKPIVVATNETKYVEIAKSCILKLRNGRAALIIMKYIKETYELAEIFLKQFKYDNSKIKLFKTDYDSDIVTRPLKPGDVIITTNIAGRGTDIKLSKDVESNGGLHVCLTFLPVNSRVEHQNIGRTSRKGNSGTSQLILCDPKQQDIEVLKSLRDIQETNVTRGALETVKRIKIKDKIFHKFCELLDKIEGSDQNAKEIEKTAVEERFAHWLILNEDKMSRNSNDVYELFDDFISEILEDDQANKLIKNPYMFVLIGNIFLVNKNYQRAANEYTNAILLDHCFAEHAYYNRAWAKLNEYGYDIDKHEHIINEAIRDLKKARKLIQDKEYGLHLLQTASKGEVFCEQVSQKINLYAIQKNTIDLAIGPDKDELNEQINKLTKELKNKDLPSDCKDSIKEQIENLKESKKDIGVIGRARQNKRNITIESLGDDYMPENDRVEYKHEITEFKRNGWLGGFKITEIKPIDWSSVFGLLAIGFGQLLIGASLAVFTLGAGASFGMGLISEGISDIITAVKDGIINRDFNWATWALMKVISIAVSVVCAGFKAMKDAARTAYAGTKNVFTQGARAFTHIRKEGWKLVAKKMGVELAKGVAKEIVTDLVSYGVDKALIPTIEEKIIEKVKVPIQKALIENPKVVQMLKLDERNGNDNYKKLIKSIAFKLLTPEKNSMLKSIALHIANKAAVRKGYKVTRTVVTASIGAYNFTTFTSDFIQKLNSELDKIKISSKTDDGPPENLESNGNEDQDCGNEYEQAAEFTEKEDENIDLSKYGLPEEQVRMKKKVQSTDKLSDEISGMVSANMLRILKGQVIKPFTQLGVGYTVDKMSTKLTSIEKTIGNYRKSRQDSNSNEMP